VDAGTDQVVTTAFAAAVWARHETRVAAACARSPMRLPTGAVQVPTSRPRSPRPSRAQAAAAACAARRGAQLVVAGKDKWRDVDARAGAANAGIAAGRRPLGADG
jgi:hypothetical protein